MPAALCRAVLVSDGEARWSLTTQQEARRRGSTAGIRQGWDVARCGFGRVEEMTDGRTLKCGRVEDEAREEILALGGSLSVRFHFVCRLEAYCDEGVLWLLLPSILPATLCGFRLDSGHVHGPNPSI